MSMLDTEILRCEDLFTVEKVLHLFGASVRGSREDDEWPDLPDVAPDSRRGKGRS